MPKLPSGSLGIHREIVNIARANTWVDNNAKDIEISDLLENIRILTKYILSRKRDTMNGNAMKNIDELTKRIIAFRDSREWKQFHNPKDLAISLNLEAGEVLEHFQWKNPEEIKKYIKTHKIEIGEELADVLYWVLLMSHDLEIDILDALGKKMHKNEKKYPVKKARGRHTKYTKF